METLLDIKNLSVSFDTYAGTVKAVRNVSFQVKEGETVAVVGESGCGKTVTAKSIMGLVKSPPGRVEDGSQILFEGKNIFDFNFLNDWSIHVHHSPIWIWPFESVGYCPKISSSSFG